MEEKKVSAKLRKQPSSRRRVLDLAKETEKKASLEDNQGRHRRITEHQGRLIKWLAEDYNGAYLCQWIAAALEKDKEISDANRKRIRDAKGLIFSAKDRPKRGRPSNS